MQKINSTNFSVSKLLAIMFIIVFSITTSQIAKAESIPAPKIRVAVASNFSPILHKLLAEFTQHTHIQVDVISGASGALFQQIRHGAPYDVFLSADASRPLQLKKEQLIIEDSLKTYAVGKLAFWSATHPINNQESLLNTLKAYPKIAISNPKTAPYGQAAFEVLTHLNLVKKYNGNTLITGINVNQTFQQIRSKAVKGGFVAVSQLTLNNLIGFNIPQQYYTPIQQQLVILKNSKQQNAAEKFIKFLLSKKTQQYIESFGYTAMIPMK